MNGIGTRYLTRAKAILAREYQSAFARWRSSRELGKAPTIFRQIRATGEYQAVFDEAEPLISVCIGTFNRARLLVERGIPSVLAQSYGRFELIIVGDRCTDDTERRVAQIADPRISFVNLPRRGEYPTLPQHLWMVGGTQTVNHALSLCRGEFITHLDDDDEMLPERLELLVSAAQSARADLVFHPFQVEVEPGKQGVNNARKFAFGRVTTGSIFYHRWFRQLGWDSLSYRYGEPGDWNRLRKFKYLGAKIVRSPHVLMRHWRY